MYRIIPKDPEQLAALVLRQFANDSLETSRRILGCTTAEAIEAMAKIRAYLETKP